MKEQIEKNLTYRSKNSPTKTLSFNDVIGAPIIFWDEKLKHIEKHIAKVQTILSKTSNPSNTPKTPENKDQKEPSKAFKNNKRKRLIGEITLLHHRRQTIRDEISRYMAHSLYYMIKKYKPEIIGYENLDDMSTMGNKGHLAKIIRDMIKRLGSPKLNDKTDFSLIIPRVKSWCLADPELADIKFEQVNARNTSKIHYQCGEKISRFPSWDFGSCSKCEIKNIDTHVNAAYNIASRAITGVEESNNQSNDHSGLGPP